MGHEESSRPAAADRPAAHHPAAADRRDVVRFGSQLPGRRRLPGRLRLVMAAALAAVVTVAVVVTHLPAGYPAAATRAHKAAHVRARRVRVIRAQTPAPVTVTEAGHRLLGVTAGWDLFARGSGVVVRVQLARGRVTMTAIPALLSTGAVSFLAGPHQAIVRPWDYVPGYLVPDGRPAREARGVLGGGVVLPGPTPAQVWVQADPDGIRSRVALAGLDGRETGAFVQLRHAVSWPVSDGQGYLLVQGATGVYDERPGRDRWVSAGTIAAVGPTRWLVRRCGHRAGCSAVLIDPASGTRRTLPGRVLQAGAPPGVISPDGSAAALFRFGGPDQVTLHLLDLRSGAQRALDVSLDLAFGLEAVAWSPDSRLLFAVAASGQLLAVNARTGSVRGLGIRLPPVIQVAVRAAR